jgi:hypothetical protein
MEFILGIRKNEIMWFKGKLILLKEIMLSDVSQTQKEKGCIFLSYMGVRHNINISNIMKNRLH